MGPKQTRMLCTRIRPLRGALSSRALKGASHTIWAVALASLTGRSAEGMGEVKVCVHEYRDEAKVVRDALEIELFVLRML